MKHLRLLLLPIFFVSCKKEQYTITETFFANTTQYVVKVKAYRDGIVDSKMSFELEPSETRKVLYNNVRGINHGLGFGYYNSPMDSFVVVFDHTRSIVHYKQNLPGANPKHYQFESARNIFNDLSYLRTVTKNTDTERMVEFSYGFTQQDYIDAQ